MNHELVNIMAHTIDLSDTMFMGLNYIDEQLETGSFEDSYNVMGSVLSGMDSIKRALPNVVNCLPSTALGHSTIALRDIFETVRENYLAGEATLVHANLKEQLLPAFKRWHDQVHEQFKPYICN